MTSVIGIHAMELLISRVCHDLVGPVGAINNGVELLEESGLHGADDAFDLVVDSAETAARRLKMFRLAFGAAGAGDSLKVADVRAVMEGWFRGSRTTLAWNATDLSDPPRGLLKLVLIAGLLAEEAMPQGGTLAVTTAQDGIRLDGVGTNATLRPEVAATLSGGVGEADLSPRTILGYAASRLAGAYGLALGAALSPAGRVILDIHPGR